MSSTFSFVLNLNKNINFIKKEKKKVKLKKKKKKLKVINFVFTCLPVDLIHCAGKIALKFFFFFGFLKLLTGMLLTDKWLMNKLS